MGCGTGVLAILASMKGAVSVDAIDIDPWCIENTNENAQKNDCSTVNCFLGSSITLKTPSYDLIFANINRNILLADMESYKNSLRENGLLFMSGFLLQDVEVLKEKIASLGLVFDKLVTSEDKAASPNFSGNWVLIKCKK